MPLFKFILDLIYIDIGPAICLNIYPRPKVLLILGSKLIYVGASTLQSDNLGILLPAHKNEAEHTQKSNRLYISEQNDGIGEQFSVKSTEPIQLKTFFYYLRFEIIFISLSKLIFAYS